MLRVMQFCERAIRSPIHTTQQVSITSIDLHHRHAHNVYVFVRCGELCKSESYLSQSV